MVRLVDNEQQQTEHRKIESAEVEEIQRSCQKAAEGIVITPEDYGPLSGLAMPNSWGTVDINRVNTWLLALDRSSAGWESQHTGSPEKLVAIIFAQTAKNRALWQAIGCRWIANALATSSVEIRRPVRFLAKCIFKEMLTRLSG